MVPTTTEGATAVLGYWTKHHRDAFGPLDDHLERRAAGFGEGRAEQHRALCLILRRGIMRRPRASLL